MKRDEYLFSRGVLEHYLPRYRWQFLHAVLPYAPDRKREGRSEKEEEGG
jgi:hypothetical protein